MLRSSNTPVLKCFRGQTPRGWAILGPSPEKLKKLLPSGGSFGHFRPASPGYSAVRRVQGVLLDLLPESSRGPLFEGKNDDQAVDDPMFFVSCFIDFIVPFSHAATYMAARIYRILCNEGLWMFVEDMGNYGYTIYI